MCIFTSAAYEDVFVSPNEEKIFDKMRANLTKMFFKVQAMIMDPEREVLLKAVVQFLQLTYDSLRPRLSLAKSLEEVLEIVVNECTITNISHLEELVDFLEIEEAKPLLQKYEREVEEKCNELPLTMSLDYLFKQGSDDQLKCNTIRFTLNWKPSERKFKDIEGVLWKAFGKKAAKNVKVVLVKTTNSIALICHAPYTMMTMLMMRAKRNIDVLIEEGVMSLFVGYYTVLDHRTHEQVHYTSVHIFLILQ